jgi:3-oxoacyl-[acyl-carrier protein] reductase
MGATLGPERAVQIVADTPLGRLGQPEDIADAAYFLLSDLSRFITGQTIPVSGGRVMIGA